MDFTQNRLNANTFLWEGTKTAWSKSCLRKSDRHDFIGEGLWVIDKWIINKADNVSNCTVFCWHNVDFFHSSSDGAVFWVCDQNGGAELPTGLYDNSKPVRHLRKQWSRTAAGTEQRCFLAWYPFFCSHQFSIQHFSPDFVEYSELCVAVGSSPALDKYQSHLKHFLHTKWQRL